MEGGGFTPPPGAVTFRIRPVWGVAVFAFVIVAALIATAIYASVVRDQWWSLFLLAPGVYLFGYLGLFAASRKIIAIDAESFTRDSLPFHFGRAKIPRDKVLEITTQYVLVGGGQWQLGVRVGTKVVPLITRRKESEVREIADEIRRALETTRTPR